MECGDLSPALVCRGATLGQLVQPSLCARAQDRAPSLKMLPGRFRRDRCFSFISTCAVNASRAKIRQRLQMMRPILLRRLVRNLTGSQCFHTFPAQTRDLSGEETLAGEEVFGTA